MRVITGTAGGLRLQTPKGTTLRPTQDRIRQVIFSSLGDLVIGARVLDLYAGTGACAIEALSRGAVSATLVEIEKKHVACIRQNLEHCHLSATVIPEDVMSFLQRPPDTTYDLIFADPPYDKNARDVASDPLLKAVAPWLAPDGRFLLEHFSRHTWQPQPGWEIIRQRSYGETGLTFWKKV
jgi:16S rRNA (guanine966-N2)-methyltransferase